ncbi:unnamed protein product [Heligmosomoides polygyrus]|uniref:GT23 domain-containing protein n=1 Tax=Heligmosomoides polygyrus TaxID=6339 RepID=A0A183GIM2_HELPZ|nr:unnamed protein product [Heligmosomoides polygyrus]
MRLEQADGAPEWRRQALQQVTDNLQRRLQNSQNPKRCDMAKFVVCDIPDACGFVCQLHHLVFCLMVAFASKRTLVIRGDGTSWRSVHVSFKKQNNYTLPPAFQLNGMLEAFA